MTSPTMISKGIIASAAIRRVCPASRWRDCRFIGLFPSFSRALIAWWRSGDADLLDELTRRCRDGEGTDEIPDERRDRSVLPFRRDDRGTPDGRWGGTRNRVV